MKKLLLAASLAVTLLAVPTIARAAGAFTLTIPHCPWKVEGGANAYFRFTDGSAAPQAGPWYLYWPLEAHFGPPAPTGYPFWPSHMTLPPNGHGHGHGHAAPAPLPPISTQPAPVQPTGFQPVSYTAPGYWYSK